MSTDTLKHMQDQVFDTVRKSQEAYLDAVRQWTEVIGQNVPKLPTAPLPDGLPTPGEVVDSVFEFAGQLLRIQRDLAHSPLSATAAEAPLAAPAAAAPTAKTTGSAK